jgi:ribonucleotide monophosphatase NagD (HAD superfamily)
MKVIFLGNGSVFSSRVYVEFMNLVKSTLAMLEFCDSSFITLTAVTT